METDRLEFLEIGAGPEDAELSVILMHGLGADGHDFEEVAEMLCRAAEPRKWRFVLPHAGVIPVTINGGMPMPAWYDILSLNHPREVDWRTVEEGTRRIEALIARESAETLVLAGFSQGGAMALHVGLRHQDRISGLLVMSAYLMEGDRHPVPEKEADLPIGIFHGDADEVVPFAASEAALSSLRRKGFAPTHTRYPGLGHGVSQAEIGDVFSWLLGITDTRQTGA